MKEFLKRINNSSDPEAKEVGDQPEGNSSHPIKYESYPLFCRIHDQYIIPLNQIEYSTEDLTTVVLKCQEELPIGRAYLSEFKKTVRLFS